MIGALLVSVPITWLLLAGLIAAFVHADKGYQATKKRRLYAEGLYRPEVWDPDLAPTPAAGYDKEVAGVVYAR